MFFFLCCTLLNSHSIQGCTTRIYICVICDVTLITSGMPTAVPGYGPLPGAFGTARLGMPVPMQSGSSVILVSNLDEQVRNHCIPVCCNPLMSVRIKELNSN